jgi:uncharacterized membrane protein
MDIRAKIPELYYSAEWLSRNADKNSKIIGDMNVFEIYSGLFEFDVSTDNYNQKKIYNGTLFELNDALLSDNVYFGSYKHTVHYAKVDYVIIDKRYFKISNEIFGEPVDIKKAEKLDKTELADKIYDNGEIAIYKNNK